MNTLDQATAESKSKGSDSNPIGKFSSIELPMSLHQSAARNSGIMTQRLMNKTELDTRNGNGGQLSHRSYQNIRNGITSPPKSQGQRTKFDTRSRHRGQQQLAVSQSLNNLTQQNFFGFRGYSIAKGHHLDQPFQCILNWKNDNCPKKTFLDHQMTFEKKRASKTNFLPLRNWKNETNSVFIQGHMNKYSFLKGERRTIPS